MLCRYESSFFVHPQSLIALLNVKAMLYIRVAKSVEKLVVIVEIELHDVCIDASDKSNGELK